MPPGTPHSPVEQRRCNNFEEFVPVVQPPSPMAPPKWWTDTVSAPTPTSCRNCRAIIGSIHPIGNGGVQLLVNQDIGGPVGADVDHAHAAGRHRFGHG